LVVPGIPHHVTQRGNRRQPTFFNDKGIDVQAEQVSRRFDAWVFGTAVRF
jgi:REP element-mobilizing transposase RayT